MSTATATAEKSLAARMADCCHDDTAYVVVNHHHESFPDAHIIRIFGHGKPEFTVNGKSGGVVGLWQLLADDEVKSLGLDIYRFTGGGLILRNDHPQYRAIQSLVAAVWRLLGKTKYPHVVLL